MVSNVKETITSVAALGLVFILSIVSALALPIAIVIAAIILAS